MKKYLMIALLCLYSGIAYAGTVCTKSHNCAPISDSIAGQMQAVINEFEGMGYNVGSIGCLSGGHMRNSKHHWGGACDLFSQYARNLTHGAPPPSIQISVAEKHGLTSGCIWLSPDCGHFESPSGRIYNAKATRRSSARLASVHVRSKVHVQHVRQSAHRHSRSTVHLSRNSHNSSNRTYDFQSGH